MQKVFPICDWVFSELEAYLPVGRPAEEGLGPPEPCSLMSRAVHVQASESTGSSCSTNPKAKLQLAGGGPRQAQP